MTAKRISCAALMIASVTPSSVAASAADPPNILVIWDDDVGYWDVSAPTTRA